MIALSDERQIQSALQCLSQKRLPYDFPFGSICLKRKSNRTVAVLIEMTFRIRPNQVDWFNDLAEKLAFDGAITLERGKNPVLVRVETSLQEAENQELEKRIWQQP